MPIRELLLRTLRMNRVPGPRVIAPGPKTKFPILFETAAGKCLEISDLTTAKNVSGPSGVLDGFFTEILPVKETLQVRVRGLKAEAPCGVSGSIEKNGPSDLAVRAAYCLGVSCATVRVGLGPGGPWVLEVKEESSPRGTMPVASPVLFLGAAVECLFVDELGGEPCPVLKTVWVPSTGMQPERLWQELCERGLVSSPMPLPGLPLSTRLVFRGSPDVDMLRALDRLAALTGMMLSPPDEAMLRHGTPEGILGSWRLGQGTFEYLSVPSLLWHPEGLKAVMAIAGSVTSRNADRQSGRLGCLEADYRWQKAYYTCDKSFFQKEFGQIAQRFRVNGSSKASRHFISRPKADPPQRGPVLGIMSRALECREDTGITEHIFGIETDRFMRLIWMAEEAGLSCYVFLPDEKESFTVQGWFHTKRSGWTRRDALLPDIVYDRHIPGNPEGGRTDDAAARLAGRLGRVRFINSLPFVKACKDKFETHRILDRDAFCRRHLPAMIPLESQGFDVEKILQFLSPGRSAYLKPRGGTGSKGMAVFGQDDDHKIRQALDTARGSYVLQEGIDMAKLPGGLGGTFEVRVICQKGGAGAWRRTGMVCRVNPGSEPYMVPGREVHLRLGEVLPLAFPGATGLVAKITESVRELGRRIPPLIEEASGRGGEMSIDMGIDRKGKPWLIEVNSKPATLFRDIGAFGLRELSLRRVVNYARFLHEQP